MIVDVQYLLMISIQAVIQSYIVPIFTFSESYYIRFKFFTKSHVISSTMKT